MTRRTPFSQIHVDAGVLLYVVAGGRPHRNHCLEIDDTIWSALQECWHYEPDRRPSMAVLFKFFKLLVRQKDKEASGLYLQTTSSQPTNSPNHGTFQPADEDWHQQVNDFLLKISDNNLLECSERSVGPHQQQTWTVVLSGAQCALHFVRAYV